jgi:SAM-dependent methyltransferase
MEVVAVDVNRDGFKANVPFISLDLNASDFAGRLGAGTFDLVTATEVIEHVESPIGFLRNVRRLLRTGGVAIMTTPNVDNAPARVKFLLTGRLRMMDDRGDPTHISPIFVDLLVRQYLPRAGLSLVGRLLYPSNGYRASRSQYALLLRLLGRLLPGPDLLGDNHVFVFRPGGEADG